MQRSSRTLPIATAGRPATKITSVSFSSKCYTVRMTSIDLQLPISIDNLRAILRSYGVVKASIFGSYARGEADTDSDLDILVQYKEGVSLFDHVDLKDELEKKCGKNVDLAMKLHPRFEPYITPDLVEIL